MSIFETVKKYSRDIKNDRTPLSAQNHLEGEVHELNDEVFAFVMGRNPGPDGIVGEVADVINCALDILFQTNPNIY